MSSPGVIRLAIFASVATTGGAIYYGLSDGGNPDRFREKVVQANESLATTAKKVHTCVSTTYDNASSAITTAVEKTTQVSHPKLATKEPPATNEQVTPSPQPSCEEIPPQREKPRSSFCHTCSGPRIWFFAEKLRLKRRFTPHPDPPRE